MTEPEISEPTPEPEPETAPAPREYHTRTPVFNAAGYTVGWLDTPVTSFYRFGGNCPMPGCLGLLDHEGDHTYPKGANE